MKSFYTNGTILTMEDDALYAEAVCVENGRIKAVGTAGDVLKLREDADEMIDLNGAVLMRDRRRQGQVPFPGIY